MKRLCAASLSALLFSATGVPAQQQLSAEQFEAEAAGKTIYTRGRNFSYGAEHHFTDRRVTLLFTSGECMSGRWEPRGDQICYSYLHEPGRWHCWTYHATDAGDRLFRLVPDATDGDRVTELSVVKTDLNPLHCQSEFFGAGYAPPYVPSSNSEP